VGQLNIKNINLINYFLDEFGKEFGNLPSGRIGKFYI
jgi:hypothetical protein